MGSEQVDADHGVYLFVRGQRIDKGFDGRSSASLAEVVYAPIHSIRVLDISCAVKCEMPGGVMQEVTTYQSRFPARQDGESKGARYFSISSRRKRVSAGEFLIELRDVLVAGQFFDRFLSFFAAGIGVSV